MTHLPLLEGSDRLAAGLLPLLVRCGAAAICGGMIGLERELTGIGFLGAGGIIQAGTT